MTPTKHTRRTVAVIGATGFCGRPIAQECAAHSHTVVAVSRSAGARPGTGISPVTADLHRLDTLISALSGCDTVIHAASYTGTDPGRAWDTNGDGTRNLIAAATHHGIADLIYLSTIGVYGNGPYHLRNESPRPSPVTELSRSRLAAEDLILDAGGLVLRPGFTYGPGAKDYFRGLARIIDALGAVVDDGRAEQSIISTAQIASTVAALLDAPLRESQRGTAVNIAEPEPRTISQLIQEAGLRGIMVPPVENLTHDEALERARTVGLTPRHVDLVAREHTIKTSAPV